MRGRYLLVESYDCSTSIVSDHWFRWAARRRMDRCYRLRNASSPTRYQHLLTYRIFTRAEYIAGGPQSAPRSSPR